MPLFTAPFKSLQRCLVCLSCLPGTEQSHGKTDVEASHVYLGGMPHCWARTGCHILSSLLCLSYSMRSRGIKGWSEWQSQFPVVGVTFGWLTFLRLSSPKHRILPVSSSLFTSPLTV